MFRVGSRDAELLAPEFRPMDVGGLADQEPFTAWLRLAPARIISFQRHRCTRRSVLPARFANRAASASVGHGSKLKIGHIDTVARATSGSCQ